MAHQPVTYEMKHESAQSLIRIGLSIYLAGTNCFEMFCRIQFATTTTTENDLPLSHLSKCIFLAQPYLRTYIAIIHIAIHHDSQKSYNIIYQT